MSEPTSPSLESVHLLVCCHGLWGNATHLREIEQAVLGRWSQARQQSPSTATPDDFRLLIPAGSADMKTLDGIDICASRMRIEVQEAIAELREQGKKVTRFSILGYSLGGLVARYLVTMLSPELVADRIELVNFITIASPAVGLPPYRSFGSAFFGALGARFLSRSGSQLYAQDTWADSGKCLLENMTEGMFIDVLKRFQRVEIYASAVNDRTVPYPTAAISEHDPFTAPLSRAIAAREARGAEETEPIQISDGGLHVDIDPDYHPILVGWEKTDSTAKADVKAAPTRQRRRLPRLPAIFKPSSYPFLSKPMRYVVAFGFPVVAPMFFLYMLSKSWMESSKSGKRIKLLLVDPQHSQMLSDPTFAERVSSALQDLVDAQMAQEPMSLPASAPGTPSRSATPQRDKSAGVSGPKSLSTSYVKADGSTLTKSKSKVKSDKLQPNWTDGQLRMLENLNQGLPQMKKHIAWFPNERNAHGTIICRAAFFGEEGRGVIRHLADHFVF